MEPKKFSPFEGSKESATAFLGMAVRFGKENIFKATHEAILQGTLLREELDGLLQQAQIIVSEAELLRDPQFKIALRLGFISAVNAGEDRETSFTLLFKERMNEVFPSDVAERISETALDVLSADIARAGEKGISPPPEALKFQEEVWEPLIDNIFRKLYREKVFLKRSREQRLSEQNTQLVPCPECKTQKRCTTSGPARTKNFRCKCGFNKPYPFAEKS